MCFFCPAGAATGCDGIGSGETAPAGGGAREDPRKETQQAGLAPYRVPAGDLL